MNETQLKQFLKTLLMVLELSEKKLDKFLKVQIIAESLIGQVGLERAICTAAKYVEKDLLLFLLRTNKELYIEKALYCAAFSNRQDLIHFLLTKTTYVDAALAGAASGGHLALMREMLKKGARMVNWALAEASTNSHIEIMNTLLEAGAEVERWFVKKTVKENNFDVLEWMVNRKLAYKHAIFEIAFSANNLEVVLWLANGEVQMFISTQFLMITARHGRLDLFRQSLEVPVVRLGYSEQDIRRILFLACQGPNPDLVKYLMTRYDIFKPPEVLEIAVEEDNRPLIAFLLKEYSLEKVAHIYLPAAAKVGNKEYVQKFYTKFYTRMILSNAAVGGHIDLVKFALDKGAYGLDYSIIRSAENGHLDILKLLVANTRSDKVKWSIILEVALKAGHIEIVKFAMENGVAMNEEHFIISLMKSRFDIAQLYKGKMTTHHKFALGIGTFDMEMVDEAIKEGVLEYKTGGDAVEKAAVVGNMEIVQRFQDHVTNWSVLLAVKHRQDKVVRFILENRLVESKLQIQFIVRKLFNAGFIELGDYARVCLSEAL